MGFLTIVALVLAYQLGGWWWAAFILMFLAWLGGKQQDQEPEAKAAIDQTSIENDPANSNMSSESSVPEWPPKLLEVCSTITSSSYYVGDLIPDKKRTAAMENYPLPGDEQILALIDATVFGSATKGLAIGLDGISWKNSADQPVKMLWSQLAQSSISSGNFKVSIGTLKFDNSGSGINLGEVEKFLSRLKEYAGSQITDRGASHEGVRSTLHETATKAKIPMSIVAVNLAEFDELLSLPGIEVTEAKMILKRRSERPFISNADLVDYLNIKPHFLTRLDGLTDFGPVSSDQAEIVELSTKDKPKTNNLGGRTID